jgi:ribosomal protein S14
MNYNYANVKDKSKRYKFKIKEPLNLILKSIIYNRKLNDNFKFYFNFKLYSFNKSYSHTQLKNRCRITNQSHSVLRLFKMNRITFKETIGKNYIQGIRKSSW